MNADKENEYHLHWPTPSWNMTLKDDVSSESEWTTVGQDAHDDSGATCECTKQPMALTDAPEFRLFYPGDDHLMELRVPSQTSSPEETDSGCASDSFPALVTPDEMGRQMCVHVVVYACLGVGVYYYLFMWILLLYRGGYLTQQPPIHEGNLVEGALFSTDMCVYGSAEISHRAEPDLEGFSRLLRAYARYFMAVVRLGGRYGSLPSYWLASLFA